MSDFLQKLIGLAAKVTPKMEVFGLEIAEDYVAFYSASKKSEAKSFSLRLPPGTVVGGRVVNADALTGSLMELHKRVSVKKKAVSVILTLPINNIYVQPFGLPELAIDNLAESAELNMRMISPVDINNAYYDWQRIGSSGVPDQIPIVGAFVAKDIADAFMEAVITAGFSIAAVEFNTLSLVRAAVTTGVMSKEKPELMIQIGAGGVSYIVSHMGELYFHHFSTWDQYRDGGKTIVEDKLKAGIADEIRKTINFYSTSVKMGEVTRLILVADDYVDKVKEIVASNLALEVEVVSPAQINPAVGAAIRGAKPRSQDTGISLASFSASEVFRKGQITNFVLIWRNIMLTTFGFLLAVFLGSAVMLQRTTAQIVGNDPFVNDAKNSAELVRLEEQAGNFNRLVSALGQINEKRIEVNPLLDRLSVLMGPTITPKRLTVNVNNKQVLLTGLASTEAAVTNFKNRVAAEAQFKNVQLPLSEVRVLGDGSAEFTLHVEVVSFDF